MRNQFIKTVEKIFTKNKRLALLLCDIGVYGFRDIIKKYPHRAKNIGILEQSTVSLAAGLSKAGLIPVVHSIAPFLVNRAYEQIKIDFGYQNLRGNIITVGASHDYASLGSTHHCPEDINLISNIPNINIIVPGNSIEFDLLFKQSLKSKNCNYYRLDSNEHAKNIAVKFGKIELLKKGKEINIIVVGPSLRFLDMFFKDLKANIFYVTTIEPFDHSIFKRTKIYSKKWLIIEHFYSGTITKKITSILKKDYKIYNISIPEKFIKNYGKKSEIDKKINFTSNKIKTKILKIIHEKY